MPRLYRLFRICYPKVNSYGFEIHLEFKYPNIQCSFSIKVQDNYWDTGIISSCFCFIGFMHQDYKSCIKCSRIANPEERQG